MSKPKFDPTKDFDVVQAPKGAKPKFDPSKAFVPASAAPSSEDPGSGEDAFFEGVARGVPVLGSYIDHLSAMGAKGIAKLEDLFKGTHVSDAMGDYDKVKAQMVDDGQKLQKAHPYASMAGNVTGGIASGGVTGMALKGVGLAGEGATALSRIGQAAAANAAMGALEGTSGDENETFGQNLANRGRNALVQGGLGAAGAGIIEGGKALAPMAKNLAERAGFKALGPYARSTMQNFEKDKINSIGRTVLDEDLLKGLPSYETIGERAAAKKALAGKNLDDVIANLDSVRTGGIGEEALSTVKSARTKQFASIDAAEKAAQELSEKTGAAVGWTSDRGMYRLKIKDVPENKLLLNALNNPEMGNVGVSRKQIADSLKSRLVTEGMDDVAGIPQKNQRMIDRIAEFEAGGSGDDIMSLVQSEAKKRGVNANINYDRMKGADIPEPEEFYRALSNELKSGGDKAAQTIEAALPGQFEQGAFNTAKDRFGNLKEAATISDKRAGKEMANRFLSPSDYGAAGIGALGGLALSSGHDMGDRIEAAAGGAALGLANKGARKYGNQLVAKGANAVAKTLANPGGYAGRLSSLLSSYEQNKGEAPSSAKATLEAYDAEKQKKLVSPKDAASQYQNSP